MCIYIPQRIILCNPWSVSPSCRKEQEVDPCTLKSVIMSGHGKDKRNSISDLDGGYHGDYVPFRFQFNLEFQFKFVFNLEFDPEFGIQLQIPILMGINFGECGSSCAPTSLDWLQSLLLLSRFV